MKTDPGNILIAQRHMNVEIGAEAALFPEKELPLQCVWEWVFEVTTDRYQTFVSNTPECFQRHFCLLFSTIALTVPACLLYTYSIKFYITVNNMCGGEGGGALRP
jgi:hypothetical protein